MLEISSGRSRLLFVELWNVLNVETVIYSQQQRDQLEGPVNVGPVYVGKLNHVCIIHVDASLLAYTHRLLPICVMISKLNHHVNRIETIVARETFRDFFKRVSERPNHELLSSVKR